MVRRADHLHLHEEILLLALEDRKGTFHWKSYKPAVGGALLAELMLEERLEVVRDRDREFVEVVDDEPIGCPTLDEALERIATSGRRATLKDWVTRLANRKDLHHEIARELARRGIVRVDEKSVLLFFRKKVYPEVNPVPERRLVTRLEKAVFGEGAVDARTAVVVALAHASELLSIPFEKDRLKKRKDRLDKIVESSEVGEVTREVIEAIQAMVVISIATNAAVR